MCIHRMQKDYQMEWPSITMEVTVISAQGLRTKTSLFCSRRIRPFTTLSTNINGCKHHHVYRTKVDKNGGANPTWGDKFQLPIDRVTFEYSNIVSSCLYLEVFTEGLVAGQSPLGWCRVPMTDIVNEFFRRDGVRHLSYQLRNRDGSRGQGVVNIQVNVTGLLHARLQRLGLSEHEVPAPVPAPATVIGIPVNGHKFSSYQIQKGTRHNFVSNPIYFM